jgi:hypothetical protein
MKSSYARKTLGKQYDRYTRECLTGEQDRCQSTNPWPVERMANQIKDAAQDLYGQSSRRRVAVTFRIDGTRLVRRRYRRMKGAC